MCRHAQTALCTAIALKLARVQAKISGWKSRGSRRKVGGGRGEVLLLVVCIPVKNFYIL